MFSRLLTSLLLLTLAATLRAQVKTSPDITAQDIRERESILASDSLAGRRTGQPGADKAARYIASEYRRLHLQSLDAGHGFLQPFSFSEHALDTSKHELTHGMNVVAYLRGSDPKLADQVVVIGAHYDHLGNGGKFALDTSHAIHYGADDNASGTAGVLEIAEHLAESGTKPKRSILFINFSGEEEGLFGSAYFTDNPLVKLSDVQAMLNMDMVGRLQDSSLIVEGLGSSPGFRGLVDSLNSPKKFHLKYFQTGTGPSDHSKFYSKNVPVLFFFTGFHEDYHRATDTKDKINAEGEAQVVKYVESLALSLANRPDKVPFTRVAGDTEQKAAGFGVYVGGVPDYGYDGDGLRIAEVREHSPAEMAGLQKGDIIVQFDEMKIRNIYDYTNGLAKHHPGDLVQYKVIRGDKTVTIPVVMGHRTAEH